MTISENSVELTDAVPLLQTIRGMCSDEEAYPAIDRKLVEAIDVLVANRTGVAALIRAKAEDRDYATMCSWRALADELETGSGR